jgi:hypothetical protein
MRHESPEQRQPGLPEPLKAVNARIDLPGEGARAHASARFVDPRQEAAIRPAACGACIFLDRCREVTMIGSSH